MKNNYPGIDPKIVMQVRCSALRALKRLYRSMEIADIEQELMLETFKALKKYNSKQAQLSTYVARVLKYKISHLVDKAVAKKRREECIELKEDDVSVDPTNDIYLKIDLNRASHLLPKKLALLLTHLKNSSISEISREHNTPRTTLSSRVHKLRLSLYKNGFDYYERFRR